MKRIYGDIVRHHLNNERQMIFLTGPRQVGKTTIAEKCSDRGNYLNWDNRDHSGIILSGPNRVAEYLGLTSMKEETPVIVFDEIHKYSRWKSFLKGFFDVYQNSCKIIVTGSGRLNIYKRGGDSLMGRYFIYNINPLSVSELIRPHFTNTLVSFPEKGSSEMYTSLLNFGGFPEPFLKGSDRFYNRWKKLRIEQLIHEDIRDVAKVQEVRQMDLLSEYIIAAAGSQISYSSLAKNIRVSVDSVIRWIGIFNSLYFTFTVRPYSKNVPKTLRKQPKIYLFDWALLKDPGPKRENLVAVHLKKAVDIWNDTGMGDFLLHYVRDKNQREVDFLVVKDSIPWFLVEVKSSETKQLSKSLVYFHELLQTKHAFQITFDAAFVEKDCFKENRPVIVPWTTLLSQLV